MKFSGLFACTLLCLAMQPPMESSLGRAPAPPVVGMHGSVDTGDPTGKGAPAMNEELFKYAVTQGGLVVVCLVMFYVTRRDNAKKAAEDKDVKEILVAIVKENTQALTANSVTTERLARAVELRQLR